MNNRSFFAGLGLGLGIAFVLAIVYTGVQSIIDFADESGYNLVTTEYGSLDEKFDEIQLQLDRSYFEEVDSEVLYDAALKGYVDGLGDPYTVYYTQGRISEFHRRCGWYLRRYRCLHRLW